MAGQERREERVALSLKTMETQLSVQASLSKQIMIQENIYNAYLIKKYKLSERSRWSAAPWFMRFYVSVLPYFIAVIQWMAVVVLILVQFYSADDSADNLKTFTFYPDDHWLAKILMWPFFFIAVAYTYSKVLVCEVDIWALKQEGVIAVDLSGRKCKCNAELWFLKHLTDASLGHWGGLIFYAVLAGCSDYNSISDFMTIILNILGYIFVFELDEFAYLLVKDIFVFHFNDETSSDDPNTPFYGKAVFTYDGARQAPLRLLCVFFVSIAILGVFMRSVLIVSVFGIAWLLVESVKMCIGGHEMSLWVKRKD